MSATFTSVTSTEVPFDAETDRADATVVEVSLVWGGDTLAVRHVASGEKLTLGDSDACDLLMAGASEPVVIEHDASGVRISPTASATLSVDGWPREALPFDLSLGHKAEILLDAFAIRLRVVAAGKAVPIPFSERVRKAGFGTIALSFAVHATLVATFAYFMPSLGANDSEAIDRDRMYAMKSMMDTIAEKDRLRQEEEAAGAAAGNPGEEASGTRSRDEEGAAGKPDAKSHGRMTLKGNAKPEEVTIARSEQIREARDSAMSQLVGALATAVSNEGPTASWGSVLNGMDAQTFNGNLWGQNPGDAIGMNGLGLSGTGIGGGGLGEGIGMSDFGGLRASMAARSGGNCANPPCMGNGGRMVGGSHKQKEIIIRTPKVDIDGRLPAEVIQRIVRMSHGRFRNCYEAGLRQNPSLGGRVAVKFMIGRDGAVSMANDAGSDMPDANVRQCVVSTFYSLSFPAPQNGTVKVVYPLQFSPAE